MKPLSLYDVMADSVYITQIKFYLAKKSKNK